MSTKKTTTAKKTTAAKPRTAKSRAAKATPVEQDMDQIGLDLTEEIDQSGEDRPPFRVKVLTKAGAPYVLEFPPLEEAQWTMLTSIAAAADALEQNDLAALGPAFELLREWLSPEDYEVLRTARGMTVTRITALIAGLGNWIKASTGDLGE